MRVRIGGNRQIIQHPHLHFAGAAMVTKLQDRLAMRAKLERTRTARRPGCFVERDIAGEGPVFQVIFAVQRDLPVNRRRGRGGCRIAIEFAQNDVADLRGPRHGKGPGSQYVRDAAAPSAAERSWPGHRDEEPGPVHQG